jgi:hypothetical protein
MDLREISSIIWINIILAFPGAIPPFTAGQIVKYGEGVSAGAHRSGVRKSSWTSRCGNSAALNELSLPDEK